MSNKNLDRRVLLAYAGLLLTIFFWAGNAVVARGTVGQIQPFALSFWRWFTAMILLLPFGLPHLYRARAVIRSHWHVLLCMAALSVATFNTLLYVAAQTTTAINITLVNTTMPVAIAVMAWLILRQSTSVRQLAGFVVAALGTGMIVARGDWQTLAQQSFNVGDVVMVVAVLAWGIYSVLLRRWPVPMHPLGFLSVMVIMGVPMLLPLYLWELVSYGGFQPSLVHIPVFAYLAIFPSILAILFWNNGVAVVGPARCALFIYLLPLVTALLAYLFLGEQWRAYHTFGGALILYGFYLSTRVRRAPERASS